MAFNEALADRIRAATAGQPVTEKRMFGGVAFLLDGKMFCGVTKDDLMLRVGPEKHQETLSRPHVRPMDFTGRPMKGYVFVSPEGCATARDVRAWVSLGIAYVATLKSDKKNQS
jgi:TfoX/Sxy family transcriptional regulator of competence genes